MSCQFISKEDEQHVKEKGKRRETKKKRKVEEKRSHEKKFTKRARKINCD